MKTSTDDIAAGALNLLLNCAAVKAGDRILLVGELGESPYFDPRLCDDIARVARQEGVETSIMKAAPVTNASDFPPQISAAMRSADKTIFLSRLGDQVRFVNTAGSGQKIMCYTLTRQHLASAFAAIDYKSMHKVHDLLVERILASKQYRIEAACGTSLTGRLNSIPGMIDSSMAGFTLDLFPVMTFPPILCHNLSGRIVLKDFILSSSTRQYADSALILEKPVIAELEDSRMVAFVGAQNDIDAIKRQLERAAGITNGDPYIINSWHCGINPYTFFEGDPFADLEYWGTVAYGSPRYTHFHAAGRDPGDISIQLFDASISFDGESFWDEGKFIFLDKPEVQAMFGSSEGIVPDSSTVNNIGL